MNCVSAASEISISPGAHPWSRMGHDRSINDPRDGCTATAVHLPGDHSQEKQRTPQMDDQIIRDPAVKDYDSFRVLDEPLDL